MIGWKGPFERWWTWNDRGGKSNPIVILFSCKNLPSQKFVVVLDVKSKRLVGVPDVKVEYFMQSDTIKANTN